MAHRSLLPTGLLAAGAVALLSACSGSGPADLVDASSLAPGSCQSAAAAINTVHREVAGISDDADKAWPSRAALAGVSTDLQALMTPPPADPVGAKVADLVQSVGFLRLGIDSHSYDDTALRRADDAAKALADSCTG